MPHRGSASNQRVEIIPLCMARDGRFVAPARSARILDGSERSDQGDDSFSFETWLQAQKPNIAFPLIHGTGGEDGSLQGYLETIGVPYVGSGVTASAIGMDKASMKSIFAVAKLPIVDFVQVLERDWRTERERILRAVNNALRLPYFVKPANGGSSVGVTKVKSEDVLAAAIEKAFRFDDKALVERGVDAREIEVSVLGNDAPEASLPGEIVAGREFYDYEDKYIENKAQLVIPGKAAERQNGGSAAVSRWRPFARSAPPVSRASISSSSAERIASSSTRSTPFPASRTSRCTRSCGKRPRSSTRG